MTTPTEALRIAREALEFYANEHNQKTLTGFKDGARIDWEAERKALTDAGYSMSHESYNGHENYVEDGRTAQRAIERIEALLEQMEQAQPVRECADNDSPWLVCKTCAAAGKCAKEQAQPVATLHDDGCFTWKTDTFRRLYDRERAGWRMDVYAAPAPALPPLTLEFTERDVLDADETICRLKDSRAERGYSGYYVTANEDERDLLVKAWPKLKAFLDRAIERKVRGELGHD